MSICKILLLVIPFFPCLSFAQPVHDAVRTCSLRDFMNVIEAGASLNDLDPAGLTPLDVAQDIFARRDGVDLRSAREIRAILGELRARGAQTGDQVRARAQAAIQPDAQVQNLPNSWVVARRVQTGRMPETLIAHGTVLYVANEGSNDVDVILANPQREVRTIRVGEGPRILAVTNGLLFIANHRSDTITVIDTLNGHRILSTLRVGQGPLVGVVVGDFLYVTILYSNDIVVINTRTLRLEETIEVGKGPQSIVVANGFLFVTSLNGDMAVVDIHTHQVVKRIPVGLLEYAPVLLGDFLFFENPNAPGLAVLDTRYLEIIAHVPVGQGPRVLAAQEDTLYVTTRDRRDIHVINWRRPEEQRHLIHLDDLAAGAFLFRGMLFVRYANRANITVFDVAPGNADAFGRILAAIPLGSCMAMELWGRHLCITLKSGWVVLLDIEQLPTILGLDVIDVEAHLEHAQQHLDALIGRAALGLRRADFVWE